MVQINQGPDDKIPARPIFDRPRPGGPLLLVGWKLTAPLPLVTPPSPNPQDER